MPSGREYRRRDGFVYRCVAGEHLLLALKRDRQAPMFLLSATGGAIWTQLAEWRQLDELVDGVVERFEVDATVARVDTEEFLAQLTSIAALETREIP
jgi:hypothetical protein